MSASQVDKTTVTNTKSFSKKIKKNIVFWSFLFPVLFAFIMVIIIPFFMGLYYSFTNWDGIKFTEFVGLQNYLNIFESDVRFLHSIIVTVVYTIMNIIFVNIVSFSLALLVTQGLKGQNIYRVGFFIPNLIGGLILGYVWQFIYKSVLPGVGLTFGMEYFANNIMLGSQNTALLALVITGTWQYAGYIMMIYVTALQNVPRDLIEAAGIDGATAWQRLKHITMPMVAPAFTITLFLTLVNSFKQFDVNVSLTNGGPSILFMEKAINGTELLALNIYNEAFVSRQMALGQAKAVIFFCALLIVALIQVYINKKKEVEM
ncbi:MAG TPA: ABC transporter permease [Firmicutes bacterium]|nr:ABC transporter permease [Bacillota bacterium]